MKTVRVLSAAIAMLIATTQICEAQQPRPKIGLALSGGGAKGCAHVGVLRQLEAMNIPIDYIAGTSMGSVVGSLYASGMSPEEIEKELTTIDWDEVLNDSTAFEKLTYQRKYEKTRYPSTAEVGIRNGKIAFAAGIKTGQKLSFLLANYLLPHLDQTDFSKLPVPFAAVATDLETGEPVVLASGDLAEAVRASMSIPGAFTPVNWGDRILVDGGVAMNVPVDVVRRMGADIVIAVDIASPLGARETLDSTTGVLGQLSSFLTRGNMQEQLDKADLVLVPDITGYGTFDFGKAQEIVRLGDTEALAKKEELSKYAIGDAEHAAIVARQRMSRQRRVTIDEIRVEGLTFVDERFVRSQMTTAVGDDLDLAQLQKDVEWLYGWDDFIGIHFGLDTSRGKNALVIRVQEKPWGPAYIRTGIGLESRYNSPAVFLLLNYTRRWINPRGAEWRNDIQFGEDWGLATEFYQPRGYDKIGFLALGASYGRSSIRAFQDDQAIGEYEVKQTILRVDAGTQMRTTGEIRLGLFQRWTDADVKVGLETFPPVNETEGGLRLGMNVNTLDEPFFPRRGARIALEILAPMNALGADEDYVVTDLRASFYGSLGRHVFSGGIYLHDATARTTPIYDAAVLGGLGNLSGYALGELVGEAGTVISLGYRNRLTRIPGISEGIYAGLLAEAGNVSEDISVDDLELSGTVFIGMNTSYGPLVFAVAKAEDRDMQYYIQIGKSF
jgi:NTE family protein